MIFQWPLLLHSQRGDESIPVILPLLDLGGLLQNGEGLIWGRFRDMVVWWLEIDLLELM